MRLANSGGLVDVASTSRGRIPMVAAEGGPPRVWAPSLNERTRLVLLGLLDPDSYAAKAATLTLHLRHRDAPDHGCGGHMGTAVGLDGRCR